jgi:hypothetical protein
MAEEIKHEKCKRCKCWRLPSQFLNAKGRKLKSCDKCRERARAHANKNKCSHGRRKSQCKECGGSGICEHNRQKSQCKECGGSGICEHNRRKSRCKECGGASICPHGRQKSHCKECGGGSICKHNKRNSLCKECGGGSICSHGRRKSQCKECGGGSICVHNREKAKCKECDPIGHLSNIVRSRTNQALKATKSKASIKYLGCTIDEFKKHIEKQFKDGMTWDNHGKWHIDHITPLKYDNPSIEETMKRLHYTNTQPLWAKDNIAKGNRYIG